MLRIGLMLEVNPQRFITSVADFMGGNFHQLPCSVCRLIDAFLR